jgi:hypothetical protein
MKILQGFLVFMGVLAVLAIVALVVGYVLALVTPDIRANMRPVVLSSEAVDNLNAKLDGFKKEAAASGSETPKAVQITVTEEEINSWIVVTLAEGNLPAREMLVNLNDGYLLAYSAWSFPWFPARTGIIGSVDVEDGKPKFVMRDFFLGKLPVPRALDTNIEGLINIMIKLNAPLEELKLDLKEVTISDGQIKIVTASRKAK